MVRLMLGMPARHLWEDQTHRLNLPRNASTNAATWRFKKDAWSWPERLEYQMKKT